MEGEGGRREGGQVAERINSSPHTNAADGRSRRQVKEGLFFFFPLLAGVLDVQLHMFLAPVVVVVGGANCSPPGVQAWVEITGPACKSEVRVQGLEGPQATR